jgi:hypothetical protein
MNSTIIDYTYVHDKKCELLKYLEERGFEVTEQTNHDIGRFLFDVAFHEHGK